MRVIIEDDNGLRIFSFAQHYHEKNVLCPINKKKDAIIQLANSIKILCDTQFPIE